MRKIWDRIELVAVAKVYLHLRTASVSSLDNGSGLFVRSRGDKSYHTVSTKKTTRNRLICNRFAWWHDIVKMAHSCKKFECRLQKWRHTEEHETPASRYPLPPTKYAIAGVREYYHQRTEDATHGYEHEKQISLLPIAFVFAICFHSCRENIVYVERSCKTTSTNSM